jgi:hypothetical protein
MSVADRATEQFDEVPSSPDEIQDRSRPVPVGRADAPAIGTLLALVAIVAWVRLWYRPGLGDWDIMTFYLPWYGFLGEHVRHLAVPGWNPFIFSGTPFAGNRSCRR